MKKLLQIPAFLLFLASIVNADVTNWTYVPDEKYDNESPWRLIISSDGTLTSQSVSYGVRSERSQPLVKDGDFIILKFPDGDYMKIKEEEDRLLCFDDLANHELVFRERPDLDEYFDTAYPLPTTKEEAILVLKSLMSAEDLEKIASMDESQLFEMNMFWGTKLRHAFGLTASDSELRKNLGGMHYENASVELLRILQKDLKLGSNQSVDSTPDALCCTEFESR